MQPPGLNIYAEQSCTENARFCRDEVCQITVSGRRACYEDGNVRVARQGIGDARGVGPSGGYRSRYVVESPGKPHAYPPMGGCLAGTITTLSRVEPDDMSDSNEGSRMRS